MKGDFTGNYKTARRSLGRSSKRWQYPKRKLRNPNVICAVRTIFSPLPEFPPVLSAKSPSFPIAYARVVEAIRVRMSLRPNKPV
jgi:hypothetical protein